MKLWKTLAKLATLMLTLAAIACAVIAYWDKIEACFFRIRDKVNACRVSASEEAGDFADWDE